MVETCRCANASFSVASISFGVTPRRAAASRSMTIEVESPLFC